MSRSIIIALSFWPVFGLNAQDKTPFNEKFQVCLYLSPSLETFGPRDRIERKTANYGTKLSYNFGLSYKHFSSPDFSMSIGIGYQNKGFRNLVEITTTDSLSNAFKDKPGVIVGTAAYIVAPGAINFHWRVRQKTRFILSTGLTPGYMITESIKGKRIPDVISSGNAGVINIENGKYDPDIFRPFYLGWNVGFAFSQYIKSKVVMVIEPTYTRGLTKAIRKDAPVVGGASAKFDSYAIDCYLGYYFNRQIKNQVKDF